MANPVLAEVIRGDITESVHRGAYAVCDAHGVVLKAAGDIDRAILPRSAVKALQAIPLVESGAADAAGFTDAEIALAVGSHGGEARHIATARGMLDKLGVTDEHLECGVQRPMHIGAALELASQGVPPGVLHHPCSGKHIGMLALARHIGVDPVGYVQAGHPVQRQIAEAISSVCRYDLTDRPCAIDGCSVPTWSIPIQNLAAGFARFGAATELGRARNAAARRILAAVSADPFLVAGTGRFCAELMRRVPAIFVKMGAEGVFCGCVPDLGIGFAVKCDDGTARAAEVTTAAILSDLNGVSQSISDELRVFMMRRLTNSRGIEVGEVRAAGRLMRR